MLGPDVVYSRDVSLSLSLPSALSEDTMVNEHCSAQWLCKYMCACFILYVYISLCCTLVK